MKIFDCFTFFNEFEILEIRLATLNDFVDYFVLVEMDKTHSGEKKPFYFEENKLKYSKYLDKIIYIKITDSPNVNPLFTQKGKLAEKVYKNEIFRKITQAFGMARWKLERFQREQIKRALTNAKDEDIIMISDLDEIPNPKKFNEMKTKLKEGTKRVGFEHNHYLYYLNGLTNINWLGTKVCYFKTLKEEFEYSPQKIRIKRNYHIFWDKDRDIFRINDGGWHFSWVGGAEKVQKKLKSYAHIEEAAKYSSNIVGINKLLNRGRFMTHNVKVTYLPTLKDLPSIVNDKQKEWSYLIKKPKPYSVAIIILNWNGGNMLEECINSIGKNTPKIYKLFIVDNGSKDDSLKFLKNNKEVVLIKNKENKGFVTGNNQATNAAFEDNPDLDYILLLNNDTKVTKNWIQPLIDTIEQDQKIGVVGPRQLDYAGNKVNAAGNIKISKNEYFSGEEIKEVDWLMGACLLIKAEVIEKIGLFDEIYSPAYYEETDFETRVKKSGFKNYYCGKSLIYHKGGASASQESEKFSHIFYRNRVVYFLKHKPLGLLPRTIKDLIKFTKEKKLPLLFKAYLEGTSLYLKRKN